MRKLLLAIVVGVYLFWLWRNRKGAKSMLLSILAVIAFCYITLGLILFVAQSRFIYYPMRDITLSPADLGLDYDDLRLTTADGETIHAWYIPAADAELTVLFCHGNGGNLMHRLDSIQIFHDLGLNCLVFDYRGYGQSTGKPTEMGTYLDAEAAYLWLVNTRKTDPQQMIVFGRSLGGAIAAYLAKRFDVAALVLESAFTSVVDMGKKIYPYLPVRWFARFRYDTAGCLEKVRCPVMIIHSPDDEIVPFVFGQRLYETAPEPKEFVEIAGGHNDGFVTSGETYTNAWRKWLAFLEKHDQQSAERAG